MPTYDYTYYYTLNSARETFVLKKPQCYIREEQLKSPFFIEFELSRGLIFHRTKDCQKKCLSVCAWIMYSVINLQFFSADCSSYLTWKKGTIFRDLFISRTGGTHTACITIWILRKIHFKLHKRKHTYLSWDFHNAWKRTSGTTNHVKQ
jgi:hypothetical protein